MNKPTLKVAYVDFWPEWNQENFIEPILKKYFNIIIDQNNPDVLFHSIFNRMQDTPKYKCKKILILAENFRPSQFKSDYSISFDPHSDTNYRLPLWQIYLLLWPKLKDKLFAKRVVPEKFDRFCSFVVSNPNNFMRNGFYNLMNNPPKTGIAVRPFEKIYSYGRYMTNDFSLQEYSKGKYWRDAKEEFFNKYKHQFAITFENNSYPYYCTEKLMDGFLSGSIPIYWGDPKINEDWNKDAFINMMKTGNDESIKLIQNMLDYPEKYKEMYSQPIFTDEQKEKHLENLKNFENWIITIIKK